MRFKNYTKFYLVPFVLGSFLAFSACSDDKVDPEPGGQEPPPVTETEDRSIGEITASLRPITTNPESMTRAIFDPDYMPILWSKNDSVSVYYSNGGGNFIKENIPARLSSGSIGRDSGTAVLRDSIFMSADETVHRFVGIYPHANRISNLIPMLNIENEQWQTTAPVFEGNIDKMIAVAEYTSPTDDVELEFTVPYSVLRVNLNGVDAGLGAQYIEFFNVQSSRGLAGQLVFNTETGTFEEPDIKMISVALPELTRMSSPIQSDIIIAPGDYRESRIELQFITDYTILTLDVTPEYVLEPGQVHLYEANVWDHYLEGRLTEDRVLSWNSEENNSFIVQPGSTFEFPVNRGYWFWETLYGMSPQGQLRAHLIWQDEQSLVNSVDLSEMTRNGKISVDLANKSGNALVALQVFDQQIWQTVWSWHLWVTDYDPETENIKYPATDTDGYPYTTMTRNLGAKNNNVYDVDAYGTIYQWGRKDPFPSAAEMYHETTGFDKPLYDIENNTITISDQFTTGNSNMLSYSVQNPTTYYYTIPTSPDQMELDWYTWDKRKSNNYLWGEQGFKSVFDPCPAGWHVPFMKGWYTHWYFSETSEVTLDFDQYGGVGNSLGEYYPCAGVKGRLYNDPDGAPLGNRYTGAMAGLQGMYWTGNTADQGFGKIPQMGVAFMITNYQPIMNYPMWDPYGTSPKEMAFSVRCVKQEEF